MYIRYMKYKTIIKNYPNDYSIYFAPKIMFLNINVNILSLFQNKKIDIRINDLKVKYDNAKKIIDYFYDEPYSTRKKISGALKMPESTVNGVINELKSANIIQETTGYSRNQIFVFSEYVEIFLSE